MNGLDRVIQRIGEIKVTFNNAAELKQASGFAEVLDKAQNSILDTNQLNADSVTDDACVNQDKKYYISMAEQIAAKNGVDPALVKAVIRAESNFKPDAVSCVGAQGLMQLMPRTAQGLGVNDAFNPVENITGGTKYLRGLLDMFGGDTSLALAAYNAGPGSVKRYGGIPPYKETRNYVNNVMQYYNEYKA